MSRVCLDTNGILHGQVDIALAILPEYVTKPEGTLKHVLINLKSMTIDELSQWMSCCMLLVEWCMCSTVLHLVAYEVDQL